MKKPKGKMMDSPVGVYSYKSNPMKPAKSVPVRVGPGMNSDQNKVNKLLQQSQRKDESLRGKSGM
jgi:hypothetical protein